MADFFYGLGVEKIASAGIDLSGATIKMYLIDGASYSPSQNVDEFLSDIPVGMRIANVSLASKTVALGVFDAADATFTAVSGAQSEYLVLEKDTGTASTSPLVCKIDSYTGLPITPNGGDISVVFPSSGIFRL